MYRLLLFLPLLLPVFRHSALTAQSFPGAITLRAAEYNQSPDGSPLAHFSAEVEVRPAQGSPYTIQQDCQGACVFDNLPKGSTLIFSATKADEHRIWVNTGDLILIHKHYLKLDTFLHPALLLAADADCNGLVNNWDIVELRKLILPIDTVLCRPWLLLDASVLLPADPFQALLPTKITIKNYQGEFREIEFLAIKIGNVNVEFPAPKTSIPAPGTFVVNPQPNPSPGAVWFGVQLPEPGDILLDIFDTGGRLLFSKKLPGQAGAQEVELPENALSGPGMYFWRMSAGGQEASGKLVRM